MDLNGCKFGDKFMTRDGRIAIVIGEHKTIRKHWYEFVCMDEDVNMADNTPAYKFGVYDDGKAFEKFDWLDIVLKID